VGLYFFHIRDDFGVVEDSDGIELPGLAALLMEVLRSANELSQAASTHPSMRFEIADAKGRIVLVAPVQESMVSWDLMAELPVAHLPMQ
jgi:uncharacterized protein DUF6894